MSDSTAPQFERYWRAKIAGEIEALVHEDPCDCTRCRTLIEAGLVARGEHELITYAETISPNADAEARARHVGAVEQFVVDSWEVIPGDPLHILKVTGHYESCMWCSTIIPPDHIYCPSCAARKAG